MEIMLFKLPPVLYKNRERERGGERERVGEAKKEKDEWMHLDSASCLVS